MAAGKEGTYDPADDPRRLRPGEIDPNPEVGWYCWVLILHTGTAYWYCTHVAQ